MSVCKPKEGERVIDTAGEGRNRGGQRCEMSVVPDNEAVCMHGVVAVHSLGTSGLNYCLTSHSKPTTVIFHTRTVLHYTLMTYLILQHWLTTCLFSSFVCGFWCSSLTFTKTAATDNGFFLPLLSGFCLSYCVSLQK